MSCAVLEHRMLPQRLSVLFGSLVICEMKLLFNTNVPGASNPPKAGLT